MTSPDQDSTATPGLSGLDNTPASSPIADYYQQYLGRAPDQGGLDYWTNALNNGTSLSDIENSIKNSQEGQINSLYQQDLGRNADASGSQFWQNALNSGESLNDINQAFINSPEYQASHSQDSHVPSTQTLPTFDPNIRDDNGVIIGARDPGSITPPSAVTVPNQQFAPDNYIDPYPHVPSTQTLPTFDPNIRDDNGVIIGARDPGSITPPSAVTVPNQQFAPDNYIDPYNAGKGFGGGFAAGIAQAPVDPVTDFVKNLNQQPMYLQNAYQQALAVYRDPATAARMVLGSLR